MKILNVDSFAQVKRQLTLGGKTHDVRETSVQQFIDNLKAAEELEAAGKTADQEKLSAQVETSVKVILEAVPTLERGELVARPIEALTAILKFIRGEMDPEVSAAAGAAAAGAESADPKAN